MAALASWSLESGGISTTAALTYKPLFTDPDPWVVATARTFHAHALMNLGQAGYRVQDEFWGTALVLEALSTTAAQRGDFRAAAAHAREAIGLLSDLGTSEDLVQLKMRLSQALWMEGQHAEATEQLSEAQRMADQLGVPFMRAMLHGVWAELERLRGNRGKARAHLDMATELAADAVVAPQFRAFLSHTKGMLAADEERLELARAEHTEALEHAIGSGDFPVIGLILVGCADLVLREGDPVLAARLLGASESIAGTIDRSIVDLPRITAEIREALTPEQFVAAYQLGQTATVDTVPALVAGAEQA